MNPISHTGYSASLFLALVALRLWCARRHRIPLAFRAGAVKALCGTL